jgi:hypothetical protein
MDMGQIIRATKTSKKNSKNVLVPDPDPEISNFSSGAPFCPVAHLTRLAVVH